MEYESNYLGDYTSFIGLKVANLNLIPNGLVGKKVGGGTYEKRFVCGSPLESIPKAWAEILENDQNLDL
jgi:predicted transcriptional regulator YdeE